VDVDVERSMDGGCGEDSTNTLLAIVAIARQLDRWMTMAKQRIVYLDNKYRDSRCERAHCPLDLLLLLLLLLKVRPADLEKHDSGVPLLLLSFLFLSLLLHYVNNDNNKNVVVVVVGPCMMLYVVCAIEVVTTTVLCIVFIIII
jgi:hypothetical protein